MKRARDEKKAHVGEQLRRRRIALNMSQADLTARIGGDRRSVTAAENGETMIQIRKRTAWEEALHLQRGSIGRAYEFGGDLETIDIGAPAAPEPEPWDRREWELYTDAELADLSEEERRERVNIFRTYVMRWPMRRDWTPPADAQERHRLA